MSSSSMLNKSLPRRTSHSVSKPRNLAEQVATVAASRYINDDDEKVAEWRRESQEKLGQRAAERLVEEEASSLAYIKSLRARDRQLDAEDAASLRLAEQLEAQERRDKEMAQTLQLLEQEKQKEKEIALQRRRAEEEATMRLLAREGVQQAPSQQRPAPVPAVPENANWNCEFCTFENKAGHRVCGMCSKSRKNVPAVAGASQQPPAIQQRSQSVPVAYGQHQVQQQRPLYGGLVPLQPQPVQYPAQQYVAQPQGCPNNPPANVVYAPVPPGQYVVANPYPPPPCGQATRTVYVPVQRHSSSSRDVYVLRKL